MKNQYAGDVNDYCKYRLLRVLTSRGATESTVSWMLTPDDASRDGRKLSYLEAPGRWRAADPDLFDRMTSLVASGARTVGAVEQSGVLPCTRFHADVVPRSSAERRSHFARTLEIARGTELLFFDPDNGLEVPSCAPGHAGSEKYLLWSELTAAYSAGHSVLVYQHFPRREREEFVRTTAGLTAAKTEASEVLVFRTPSAAFFLAAQKCALDTYRSRALAATNDWKAIAVARV